MLRYVLVVTGHALRHHRHRHSLRWLIAEWHSAS